MVQDGADPQDLADPAVLCIECRGSAQIWLKNLDHHDTDRPLPPACVQAYAVASPGYPGEQASRLLEHMADADVGNAHALQAGRGRPGLSDVCSGLLLTARAARDQLLQGLRIIGEVVREHLGPYGPLPEVPACREYLEAERGRAEEIDGASERCLLCETVVGRKAGFPRTEALRILGALYKLRCHVVIAFSPSFRTGTGAVVAKYTRRGNRVQAKIPLPYLNESKAGWQGPSHGTVIALPWSRRRLALQTVIEMVKTRFWGWPCRCS